MRKIGILLFFIFSSVGILSVNEVHAETVSKQQLSALPRNEILIVSSLML